MKLVWVLVLLLLILCAATSLLLLNFSLSSYSNLPGFSSSHLLVFSVFNTVICAILAKSHTPSGDVLDGFLPVLRFVYGAEEGQTEETQNTYEDNSSRRSSKDDYEDDDENVVDDGYSYGPDSYNEEEEDDHDGSDDMVGWADEEEESDNNLESRIEEFIAKVKKGWEEEFLMEHLQKKYVN